MTNTEIKEFYKEQVEWYKKQVEWYNKEIKILGEWIKREKYDWGYSLQGEKYIKERNRAYKTSRECRQAALA